MSAICEEIELEGALTGECSPLALLRACYVADRASMAGNAIRKAFAACGTCPFSKTIMRDLIKENAGIMPGKAVEAKVKSAVSSVMRKRNAALNNYGKKNKKRKTKVRKNRAHNPKDIATEAERRAQEIEQELEEKEKRAEAREEKRAQKAEEAEKKKKEKERRTCKGENCKPVWKSSNGWLICNCKARYVCPKRSEEEERKSSRISHSKSRGAQRMQSPE